jgi:D-glycero-D-manno-heptose 1,7-bisphosphate phosphatase
LTRTIAILAGGMGTRVASLTGPDAPKALLPLAGSTFLDHKLREAERLGASRAVLLLGHGADKIATYVKNESPRWGLSITARIDGPSQLGTGGALKHAIDDLGDFVWVTYGDSLLDADLAAAEADADAIGCTATMTVLRNEDRWQTSNVSVEHQRVTAYEKGAAPGTHAFIDYGYLFVPTARLAEVDEDVFDVGVVVQRLIEDQQLAAFEVKEPFHDIGTPEAWAETDAWLRSRT